MDKINDLKAVVNAARDLARTYCLIKKTGCGNCAACRFNVALANLDAKYPNR